VQNDTVLHQTRTAQTDLVQALSEFFIGRTEYARANFMPTLL
jgi:hypothetical protein